MGVVIKEQSHKNYFLPLVTVLCVVSILVTLTVVGGVYLTALSAEKTRLHHLVDTERRFISSIAKFDAQYNDDRIGGGAASATIYQILDAFAQRNKIGETGEFVLGRKDKDQITFLLKSRHLNEKIFSIPFMSTSAEPMRRALLGQSGVMIGDDYRSVPVIAAYANIPELNLGLVAKIDVSEFRKPFIKTMIIACLVAVFLIFLGGLLLRQINDHLFTNASMPLPRVGKTFVSPREHFFYFILILSVVSGVITMTSVSLLYNSSYQVAKSYLTSFVKTESLLIRSVARFDVKYTTKAYPGAARAATLSQIINAIKDENNFKKTIELVLGQRKGDHVIFFNQERATGENIPSIHITAPTSKPMRQALMGQSGFLVGPDYRGIEVLAAYEAIPELDVGLVVKMDVLEIIKPFIRVTILTLVVAMLSIFSSGFVLLRSKRYGFLFSNKSLSNNEVETGFSLNVDTKMPLFLAVFVGCLAISILVLDFMTPLGISVGSLYPLVVLAGWWLPSRRHIFALAILTTLFTIFVYVLSPSEMDGWVVLINRIYALGIIWATALIISLGMAAKNVQARQTAELSKLSLAVEHSPSSVIITDLEGKVEYVNKKYESVTGYSYAESIGQNLRLLKSGKTPIATYKNLWKTILSGHEWRGDLLNKKKNGAEYWESVAILPIKSPKGKMLHFLALREDISDRKAAEEKLKHMANHDALTELPTRRLGLERLAGTIALARREHKMAAVLFVDLDGFKAVNDTLGHDAGDQLLIEVADRMLACVREIDTVARIGGDEFICILGGIETRDNAATVAQKIIKSLSRPFPLDDDVAHIGASIGLSFFPDHGGDPETLIKCADDAMYVVKNQGKNNFVFAKDV